VGRGVGDGGTRVIGSETSTGISTGSPGPFGAQAEASEANINFRNTRRETGPFIAQLYYQPRL
jgi:hypothetical protein